MWGLSRSKVDRALLILALAEAPIALQLLDLDRSYLFFAFGLAWAVALYGLIEPEPRAAPVGLLVYAVTAAVSIPLLVGLMRLMPPLGPSAQGLARFFLHSSRIGVREELCKSAPLLAILWIGLRLRPPFSSREGMVYGVMAGLSFAAIENLETFHRMAHLDQLTSAHGIDATLAWSVAAALSRLVLTPLAHACWSGAIGFAFTAPGRGASKRLMLGGATFLTVSVIHGLYDACATLGNRIGVGVLLGLSFGFLLFLLGRAEPVGERRSSRVGGRTPSAPEPLGLGRLAWPIALAAGALALAGWSLTHFAAGA
ncbi:MAG: PrsW family glutamic-type intramembrane protease [Myxococcales bacterium]